jgi:HEAT repeat protein
MNHPRRRTPDYLRVIDGGKSIPKKTYFTKSMLLTTALIGAAAVVSFAVRQRSDPLSQPTPQAAAAPYSPQEKLSDRMQNLSNKELIGMLIRQPGQLTHTQVIEHNMASLLLEMRGSAALPDLTAALEYNAYPSVRTSIAYSIGRIGERAALPSLGKAAESDPDESVKAAAREAIGQIERR